MNLNQFRKTNNKTFKKATLLLKFTRYNCAPMPVWRNRRLFTFEVHIMVVPSFIKSYCLKRSECFWSRNWRQAGLQCLQGASHKRVIIWQQTTTYGADCTGVMVRKTHPLSDRCAVGTHLNLKPSQSVILLYLIQHIKCLHVLDPSNTLWLTTYVSGDSLSSP